MKTIAIITTLFALINAPGLVHGRESFLPHSGEDAANTHIEDKFLEVRRQHLALDRDLQEVKSRCKDGSTLHCGHILFRITVNQIKSSQKTGKTLLRKVNNEYNSIQYEFDIDLYGEEEYWATPAEFMANNAGDCEDYALAKYYALRELGWPEDEMSVIVLWNENTNIHHAILLVEYDGEEWILDNEYRSLMRPTELSHYTPLYAINYDRSYYYHRSYAENDLIVK